MTLVLRAEWTKLRTTAGTWWLLLGVVVVTVAVSAGADAADICTSSAGCHPDVTRLTLTGTDVGQALAAIVGALAVTGEYGTGMIRTTLAAVPCRTAVLAAKAVVVTALTLAAGAVAVLGSVLAGTMILPGHGLAVPLLGGPVPRAAAGTVLYLALIALLGLGVAAAVRDAAAAIGLVLGLLYIFPILGLAVASPGWQRHLQQVGPMSAGLEVQAGAGLRHLPVGPWAGLGVVAAWALAALVAGGLVLRFRDA